MNAILTSNRIDNIIGDITVDSRVDTLLDDPSSAVYVSKENTLETSATSLRVIVDAHVNRYSDIRAFFMQLVILKDLNQHLFRFPDMII